MLSFVNGLNKYLIESYLWIALGAALMGFEMSFIFNLSLSDSPVLLIFGGTLFTYQFHRWYTPSGPNFKSVQIVWMGLGLFITSIGVLNISSYLSLLCLSLSGLISLLYIVPFRGSPLGDEPKKSFRERRGFKLWVISFTWVLTTVLLPLSWQLGDIPKMFDVLLVAMERLCFIAAITIPFDIRDIYTDSRQLETYPQQMGMRKSKHLSYLLLVIGLLCAIGLFYEEVYSCGMILGLVALNIASLLLICIVNEDSRKWYFTVVLDGLTVLHGVAIIAPSLL